MAIAHVDTDFTTLGEYLGFSLSATPSDDDFLLLIYQTAADETTAITGLGFTIGHQEQVTQYYGWAYKIASSESGSTYDFSTGNFNDVGILTQWSGVNTSVPLLDENMRAAYGTHYVPPVVLPAGGVHLIGKAAIDSYSNSYSGDGYTQRANDGTYNRCSLWSLDFASVGASDDFTTGSVFVNNAGFSFSLNPAGTPTSPALVQTVRDFKGGSGFTGHTVSGSYTSGNILVAMCAVDKTVGTWSTPTGWTLVEQNVVASTSGQMVWREASGTSADDVAFSWSTGQDQSEVKVFEFYTTYSSPQVGVSDSSVSDTADTGKTVAPTNPGDDGFLVAFSHIDTAKALTSFSGGVNRSSARGDTNSDASGTAGWCTKGSADSLSVTSTYGSSDQNGLIVAFFTDAGGAGSQSLTLPTVASTASLAAPTVSPGAVGLSLPSIASTASLFAQTVSPGAVGLSLPTLVSSATLFAPEVALGAGSQSLVLPTIAAGSVLHEMTLAPGAVSLVLPLIASGATLYASTVAPGAVSVVLPVLSESSVFAGSVSVGSVSVSLPTISSGATLFAVAVAAGTATVSLPLIASAATLYAGTLTVGNATVTLPAISGGSVLYSQTIVGGTISPNVNDIPATRNNVILTKLDRAGRRLAMLEKNP